MTQISLYAPLSVFSANYGFSQETVIDRWVSSEGRMIVVECDRSLFVHVDAMVTTR
jgi:hypothetical protein